MSFSEALRLSQPYPHKLAVGDMPFFKQLDILTT